MKDPLSQLNDLTGPGDRPGPGQQDPMRQLPRKRFSIDRNVLLPIVIVIVLIVPILWLTKVLILDRHRNNTPPINTNVPNDATNQQPNVVQKVSSDTDGDGLTDAAETNVYKTDPVKKDTDGDGHDDAAEIVYGYNPLGVGTITESQRTAWATSDGRPVFSISTVKDFQESGTVYLNWKTTVPATTVINYGSTNTYGRRFEDTTAATDHNYTLEWAGATMAYSIWVCSATPDPVCTYLYGSLGTNLVVHTYSANHSPVISNANIVSSSSNTMFSWTTDIPTDGAVYFTEKPRATAGHPDSYESSGLDYTGGVTKTISTSHTITTGSGQIGKTLHYIIQSCAQDYETNCSTTSDATFKVGASS